MLKSDEIQKLLIKSNLLRDNGQIDKALATLNPAVQSVPDLLDNNLNANIYLNIGVLFQAAGRRKKAIQAFEKSLNYIPYLSTQGWLQYVSSDVVDRRNGPWIKSPEEYFKKFTYHFDNGNKNIAILYLLLSISLDRNDRKLALLDKFLSSIGKRSIKIGFIPYYRFGHLILNTDAFLRKKNFDLNETYKDSYIILSSSQNPQNVTVQKLFSRVVPIIEDEDLYYILMSCLSKEYVVDILHNDRWNTIYDTSSIVSFTDEEYRYGLTQLKKMGVDADKRKIVCFFYRDHGFMQQEFPNCQSLHVTDRNSKEKNYYLSIKYLLDKGYYVFRMGAHALSKFNFSHPRFIDYAVTNRSDFLDIFLYNICHFVLGTPSGGCDARCLFDKPFAAVNTVPFCYQPVGRKVIFITKLLKSFETNDYVPLSDYLGMKKQESNTDERILKMGLYLVENTESQILALTKEMVADLDENNMRSNEVKNLQKKFDFLLSKHAEYKRGLGALVCASFLLEHRSIITQ